jgi:protein MpaA
VDPGGLRPRAERGAIPLEPEVYGRSRQGRPLEVYLPARGADLLVVGGFHGEEPETTVGLSSALRCLPVGALRVPVVLAANPDGVARGTRCNAAGVDLNRNFPAPDWGTGPVVHCWTRADPQDVVLSPGDAPASEPETRALMALVERLRPVAVVSVHAPLACVEDRDGTAIGSWLADRSGLPVVDRIAGPAPGTLGGWLRARGAAEVVYEVPVASKDEIMREHVPVFVDLLRGAYPGASARNASATPGIA